MVRSFIISSAKATGEFRISGRRTALLIHNAGVRLEYVKALKKHGRPYELLKDGWIFREYSEKEDKVLGDDAQAEDQLCGELLKVLSSAGWKVTEIEQKK